MCQQSDAPPPMVMLFHLFGLNSLHLCIIYCAMLMCLLFTINHFLLDDFSKEFTILIYIYVIIYLHFQINTCNGYYCDSFTPTRNDVPKMFTENWSGWYVSFFSPNNFPFNATFYKCIVVNTSIILGSNNGGKEIRTEQQRTCLLYTSDAADE